MKKYRDILIFIFLSFLMSCNNTSNKKVASEYILWINDTANNYRKRKDQKNIFFETTYRPLPYIIANEFRSDHIDDSLYQVRKLELEGMHYFSMRIQAKNGGDILMQNTESKQEYFKRVNHYSYDFQKNITLIENQDTINCKLFNFIRTHGIAPYVDFVFAFPSKDKQVQTDLKLIVEDEVFGVGKMNFLFKKERLNNLPKLITQ